MNCSATQHKELFYAVLGGLGQFGIIVGAKVKVVKKPSMVSIYALSYDYQHLEEFVEDHGRIMKSINFIIIDHCLAFVFPLPWKIPLGLMP